jgi:predicted nucleic acid-binding protein
VRKRVFVDTGPLVALFDHSDAAHLQAREFFFRHEFDGIVTVAVIAEVAHLLGFQEFLSWLKRAALRIEEVAPDLDRIIELMTKYSDVPMDFADATIVAASERLRIRDIVTLDSDFLIYRLRDRQHLRNLFPS